MSIINHPLNSLKQGHWFKLICGASYQHLPSVRNLALAYALAGADCIDVAADPAAIAAAKAALKVASEIAADWQRPNPKDIFNQRKARKAIDFGRTPMLMVSLNDGEDPHFRKAEFDPAVCPPTCPRPCEKICPAEAIAFPHPQELNSPTVASNSQSSDSSIVAGVIDAKCYGCGRCVPVCPLGLIQTRSYVSTPQAVAELVLPCGVDAVEIHTQVGRLEDFKRLWKAIAPWVHGEGSRTPLKLIAISCPDGENLIDYLWSLYQVISPLPCPLIWQTDGRPMSGDIGAGTTHASIKLGQKVLGAGLPGYVQLAGGTNHHTVSKLRSANLLQTSDNPVPPLTKGGLGGDNPVPPLTTGGLGGDNPPPPLQRGARGDNPVPPLQRGARGDNPVPPLTKGGLGGDITIAGVAYGSYARVLLSPLFDRLEQRCHQELQSNIYLENYPDLLESAVNLASSLVSQLKMGLELQCSTHNTKR